MQVLIILSYFTGVFIILWFILKDRLKLRDEFKSRNKHKEYQFYLYKSDSGSVLRLDYFTNDKNIPLEARYCMLKIMFNNYEEKTFYQESIYTLGKNDLVLEKAEILLKQFLPKDVEIRKIFLSQREYMDNYI